MILGFGHNVLMLHKVKLQQLLFCINFNLFRHYAGFDIKELFMVTNHHFIGE